MNLQKIIDKVIKELWVTDIAADYNAHRLLKEDSLKNSFYFHLRRRLGDVFLDVNHLRIFTEFDDGPLRGTGKRADIAIVKLKPEGRSGYSDHLREYVEDVVAIIELKHKSSYSATNEIYSDFRKLKDYIKYNQIDCQYYEGVIHEVSWDRKEWLDKRATNNWADGRVTELVASYDEDWKMEFQVYSYNYMNPELNDKTIE